DTYSAGVGRPGCTTVRVKSRGEYGRKRIERAQTETAKVFFGTDARDAISGRQRPFPKHFSVRFSSIRLCSNSSRLSTSNANCPGKTHYSPSRIARSGTEPAHVERQGECVVARRSWSEHTEHHHAETDDGDIRVSLERVGHLSGARPNEA